VISIICAVELFIVNILVAPGHLHVASISSWNGLMEACFLVLGGYLLSKFRVEMELTRQKDIELEIANKDLEAFDYTVAHDLRQPLNLLNSYCQVIDTLIG